MTTDIVLVLTTQEIWSDVTEPNYHSYAFWFEYLPKDNCYQFDFGEITDLTLNGSKIIHELQKF